MSIHTLMPVKWAPYPKSHQQMGSGGEEHLAFMEILTQPATHKAASWHQYSITCNICNFRAKSAQSHTNIHKSNHCVHSTSIRANLGEHVQEQWIPHGDTTPASRNEDHNSRQCGKMSTHNTKGCHSSPSPYKGILGQRDRRGELVGVPAHKI